MLGIGLTKTYENYQNKITELNENYIKINGEITFVGKTGTGIRTKALLMVNYYYSNINYSGKITRKYEKEGYYKKGDEIIIYINKNNANEIK
jgi:predicted HicB family RNase H-like nuclease